MTDALDTARMVDTAPPVPLPTTRQVLRGSAVAIIVATAAMVFFVLPAEMGIDPTGFGEKTGLTGLSKPIDPNMNIYLERGLKRKNALFVLDATTPVDEATLSKTLSGKGFALPAGFKGQTDKWSYNLLPYEGIETKYRMVQGQPMIFAWKSTGPVHFDMHSVPDSGGDPATESFAIADANAQGGVYIAPFTGIHGWYWQNQTLEPVTVTVTAAGGFTEAVVFNQSGPHPRPLTPIK